MPLKDSGGNVFHIKRRQKLKRKGKILFLAVIFSNFHHSRCFRIPIREGPKLVSTLNENDVEFNELSDHQICNHFEGIHQLTTKQGFCDLSKELHHQAVDGQDITPRCYNLGDPIHRDEYIDDFRVNAAIIILKYYVAGRVAHVLQSPKLSNNANSLSMMDPFTPEVASTIPPILSASSTVRCSATQQATVNGENSNPSSTTKNSHPLTGGNPLQSMILDASSHLFKNVLFALNQ